MAVAPKGRPAISHYHVIERFDNCTLLSVELQTGRTHQIRVHLSHRHHPLVGDPLYGGRVRLRHRRQSSQATMKCLSGFQRQALHACSLSFQHPVSGRPQRHRSHLPEDFSLLLSCLRRLPRHGESS